MRGGALIDKTHGARRAVAKGSAKVTWDLIGRRKAMSIETLLEEPGVSGVDTAVRVIEGPVWVEPRFGYAIAPGANLVWESLETDFHIDRPPWRYATPSPLRYAAARLGRAEVIETDAAILLRDPYEWNFFHFHFDVLGRLEALDEVIGDRQIPIVVGAYVDELPFPRRYLEMGDLATRTWIDQGTSFVRAKRLFYCRSGRSFRQRSDYVQDAMGLHPLAPEVDPQRRVYLVRARAAGRVPTNYDDVAALLERRGFETVDAATLSVHEQIEMFQQTRFLVALHGAGLTNLVYRRGSPLSMIEMHSAEYGRGSDFSKICAQYGFGHRSLECAPDAATANAQHADYAVDLAVLDAAVTDLLAG